jgi:hypothetical protein
MAVRMAYIESGQELVESSQLEEGGMKGNLFLYLKTLVLLVALIGLGACAGTTMQGYSGPALPADQTAVVRSGPYTDLVSVDGVRVSGRVVSLLPEKHTIVMRPSNSQTTYGYKEAYILYSNVDGSLDFTGESGHTYSVYVNVAPTPTASEDSALAYTDFGPNDTGFIWIGYVTDEMAGKRLAETDRLALQAEPRAYPTGAVMLPR